jgi:hypothetical protein
MPQLSYPADDVDRARGRQWLVQLKASGFRAHVVAVRQPWQTERDEAACRGLFATLDVFDPPVLGMLKGLFAGSGNRSYLAASLDNPAIGRQVDVLFEKFGRMPTVCLGPLMSQYVPTNTPLYVLDLATPLSSKMEARTASTGLLMRRLMRREAAAIRQLETEQARAADITLVTDELEHKQLLRRSPRRQIVTVPHAVNVGAMDSVLRFDELPPRLLLPADFENTPALPDVTRFVQEVWPAIRNERRGVALTICCDKATRRAKRLAEVPGVELAHTAVESQIKRSVAVIYPFAQPAGMELPVLATLAAGRAAVMSPMVAERVAENLRPPLIVADSTARWAEATSRLIGDRRHAHEMGKRGHEAAMKYGSVDVVWEPLMAMLAAGGKGLIGSATRPSAVTTMKRNQWDAA